MFLNQSKNPQEEINILRSFEHGLLIKKGKRLEFVNWSDIKKIELS